MKAKMPLGFITWATSTQTPPIWRAFRGYQCHAAKIKISCPSACRSWESILTRQRFCGWHTPTSKLRRTYALDWFVISFAGAGAAEDLAFAPHFSAKVDALATCLAYHALTLVSGKLLGRQLNFHPLCGEEIAV